MQKILKLIGIFYVIFSIIVITGTTYALAQVILKTFKVFYPIDPVFAVCLWVIVFAYFVIACCFAVFLWATKVKSNA